MGLASGQWLLRHRRRWSLSYYMLHQPVMIGSLLFVGWVLGR